MFVNFFQRDEAKLMPLLPEVTKVMSKWQRIHGDEVHMVNTAAFLKKEMYGKAKEEASKFTGTHSINLFAHKSKLFFSGQVKKDQL